MDTLWTTWTNYWTTWTTYGQLVSDVDFIFGDWGLEIKLNPQAINLIFTSKKIFFNPLDNPWTPMDTLWTPYGQLGQPFGQVGNPSKQLE